MGDNRVIPGEIGMFGDRSSRERDGMSRTIDIVLPHLRAGGIERSVVCVLPALLQRGLSVRLLLGRRDGALLAQVPDGVAIVDLGGRRATASIRALARLLKGRDIVLSGTNARNLAVLAATRLIARADRPAVIISEHTSAAEYMAAARHRGLRRLMIRHLYPGAARLAVPILSLAEGWTDLIGPAAPQVQAIPNAIFDDAAPDALAQGAVRDPDLIVAMGRLHPAKGHDRVIAAFAQALQRRPALRLDIWGEGEERQRLQDQISAAGLAGRVRLCGLTARPLAVLAGAGALVMGSRREGYGNVVIEALSVGTPVIATDCLGPRAILSRWPGAGRIAPNTDDPAALSELIVAVSGDPQVQAAAAQAAAPAREAHTADQSAATMIRMIDEVLAGRSP